MSHFLDRLNLFLATPGAAPGEHGATTGEDRTWENAYRDRWAHDKIVRSTHGVNCTGSAPGRFTSKASSPGKPNRPTTQVHPLGHAQPRTTRLRTRCQLQLVLYKPLR